MATYPVVNTKTGEQKEVMMSITEWDQWCKDNPDWLRDYSDPSTMPGVGDCLLYTSPSPRDGLLSRMPSSA